MQGCHKASWKICKGRYTNEATCSIRLEVPASPRLEAKSNSLLCSVFVKKNYEETRAHMVNSGIAKATMPDVMSVLSAKWKGIQSKCQERVE